MKFVAEYYVEKNKDKEINKYIPVELYCSMVEEGIPVIVNGEYYVPLNPFMGELKITLIFGG